MHHFHKKDFILVIIGQIISLFGNAALRFALPLYILDISGSPALFGLVSATAFIPMILLSPVGGIIADRVNKQRIMVVLDFCTAGLIAGFLLLQGQFATIPLVVAVMMLLYGISGAYQPAVQASVPLLVPEDKLVAANAAVNLVGSLSGLLGPVIGGILYSEYGLQPILVISAACFLFSAVMELFIKIPHTKRPFRGGMLSMVKSDLRESLRFVRFENPIMLRLLFIIVGINLFFSAMLSIGMPVIVTRTLALSSDYYGYTQGAMAVGGLLGGLLAGIIGGKLAVRKTWMPLLFSAAMVLPIALALLLGLPAMSSFWIIMAAAVVMMAAVAVCNIQMISYVQSITPGNILGKVMSTVMALCMCAQPVGQAVYGLLFEHFPAWSILLMGTLLTGFLVIYSRNTFQRIPIAAEKTQVAA